jgi:hypothetical protein
VPAIGVLRRIQALHAIGHTGPQIAADAGVSLNAIRSIGYHRSTNVRAATAQKIDATYERLCMVRPEGQYANRARSMATRRGWAPPLAWDDIDDPNETPHGWEYSTEKQQSRRDILLELDERRAGITAVCRALKVKRESVERWCERHGMRDVYERAAARETPWSTSSASTNSGAYQLAPVDEPFPSSVAVETIGHKDTTHASRPQTKVLAHRSRAFADRKGHDRLMDMVAPCADRAQYPLVDAV